MSLASHDLAENDEIKQRAQSSSAQSTFAKTSTTSSTPPFTVTEQPTKRIPSKTSPHLQSGKETISPIGLPAVYSPVKKKVEYLPHRQVPELPAEGPQVFEHFTGAKKDEINIEYMTPKGKESQSSDLSRRSRAPYGPEARNLLPIDERETDTRNPDELHTEPYDIRIQPRRREDEDDEVHLRAVSRQADAGRHPQRATTPTYNDI